MRVCLRKKRITLSRVAIAQIGNPSHLDLRYDEQRGVLYFSPALPGDFDAYEIPKCYWTDTHQVCEISRIAFLRALQYRLGWEDDGKYYFEGRVVKQGEMSLLAFSLTEGVKVR